MKLSFKPSPLADRDRGQPSQRYSSHYLPAASGAGEPATVAKLPRMVRRRSTWLGAMGLAVLGGLIWAVAELGYQPPLVEAQATQEVMQEPLSPWQSASFPVEEFLAYTSAFGYRDHPFGGRSFHYGLDIAAPMGSYIRAWWSGQVVEVTDDTACGTSVVIESSGWLHIYCHLQGYVVIEADGDRWLVDHDGGIKVRQGDTVESGQRIGRIGMTGRTTGPHLHWGMKYQGTWVDPAVVVKAMLE
ncbi:MAG: M23 family metallopeptidase [Cyanobacteria bacterium J06607_6]